MSKPSRLIAAAALAVALAVPAFLYATGGAQGSDATAAPGAMPAMAHGAHGSDGAGMFLHHLAGQLNLSADQKDKIKAVFTAHKDQLQTQMTQLHQARTTLANAVHADTFDENAIRTAAAALGQAEADGAVLHAQLFGEVKLLLTPDQLAKAKELLAQHQQKAQSWFQHMQQHHSGQPSSGD